MKSFDQTIKFAAVVTFKGLLYVIGGEDKNNVNLSTVQRYNPEINLWQNVASLSIARGGICAVAGKHFLYAVGGSRLKIVERFDATEKAWSMIAPTLEGRSNACGVAVNQKVFVFGGLRNHATEATFCEVYDPAINTWSNITSTVVSRDDFISAVSFKGKVYLCGCFEQDDSEKMSLQEYDADSNEWKFCSIVSLGYEKYNICSLRIPKEV